MLGGLALKWRWRERMKAAGKPTDRPNLVMGVNVQVCWDKFCRYWDVEPRLVPMEGDRFHLTAEEAVAHCDENTIGVVAILGSTFDGSYEPVEEICAALDELAAERGPGRPGARRRRLRRLRRAVRAARARVGLPRSRACSRSTPRGTSTASCTRASAGRSGATPSAARATSCSTSTTSAASMPTFALNFSRPGQRGAGAVLHVPRPRAEGYRRGAAGARTGSPSTSPREIAAIGPVPADHRRQRAAGARLHARSPR